MQKSFLPKETLELKRAGASHIFPLKHAIVQDTSRFDASSHLLPNQPSAAVKFNAAAYTNAYSQRMLQAEALEREIEARSGIRYVPAETLVAKELLTQSQFPTRVSRVEREYFIQKQDFLQGSRDTVQHSRSQSRESLSEFNACRLPSGGLDSDHQFHEVPASSVHQKSLHSIIQHWPSRSNDPTSRPKLLLELEQSLQSGLQLPQNISSDFNFNALALHSDVFDRYIQHTGTYRGLLAGVKDMYDRAISFM
jgi:hypothetical protein